MDAVKNHSNIISFKNPNFLKYELSQQIAKEIATAKIEAESDERKCISKLIIYKKLKFLALATLIMGFFIVINCNLHLKTENTLLREDIIAHHKGTNSNHLFK